MTERAALRHVWRLAVPAIGGLLDLVYPPRCLVCDRYDTPALCETCYEAFTPLTEPTCPACGRSVERREDGGLGHCHTCAEAGAAFGRWAFDTARTAAIYEGPMRHAIHRLKYDSCEALAEPLGAFLANRIAVDGLLAGTALGQIDGIAAIPISAARERRRGFNQARLLAEPVAAILGVDLLDRAVIERIRRAAQVGLAPRERRRNLTSAFSVAERQREAVEGRHLLLIDDVFTTGSSLHECARALKAAGAASVIGVTLAGGG